MKKILFMLLCILAGAQTIKAQEAYAVYTSTDKTLTFYYDNYKNSHSGTKYGMNEDYKTPGWYDDHTNNEVVKVVFDKSFEGARPTVTYYWFANMFILESIEHLEYLNTSEVINMSDMFYNCQKLKTLYLNTFNTSKVTRMASMFSQCKSLYYIYFGYIDTSNVWSMSSMFQGCEKFKELNLSRFNTSNVTQMDNMFNGCTELEELDLGSFNTSKVKNMEGMFKNCSSMQYLGVNIFNTSNVTNMTSMFSGCSEVRIFDLTNFDTGKVTKMNGMFYECNKLSKILVGDNFSTANVTVSNGMFYNCTNLVGGKGTKFNSSYSDATYAQIDGGTYNPGYLTSGCPMYAVYSNGNLTLYCKKDKPSSGNVYTLTSGYNTSGWCLDDKIDKITNVVIDASFVDAQPESVYAWFTNLSNLKKVTGMYNFNGKELKIMTGLFRDCRSLVDIDLTDAYYKGVLKTPKLEYMSSLFSGCTSLKSVDMRCFDTKNVWDMRYIFYECSNLTTVDLSGWKTRGSDLMTRNMFSDCAKLKTIYVTDSWDVSNVSISQEMFKGCTSLVGGSGTKFDPSHTDKAYARIDVFGGDIMEPFDAEEYPGYLTAGKVDYVAKLNASKKLVFCSDWLPNSYLLMSGYAMEDAEIYPLPRNVYETPQWLEDDDPYGYCPISSITSVVFNSTFKNARPASTYMWFSGMKSLKTISGLQNLNTSAVTVANSMFQYCSALESLDLRGFDASNMKDLDGMFRGCTALTNLDLSSFNTRNVEDMGFMFYICQNLKTIYVSDKWSTANVVVSANMFKECNNLVGGMGTKYNASYVDKTYARIDGGTSSPGYFTYRSLYDLNNDGKVSTADIQVIINQMKKPQASQDMKYDLNNDGKISTADIQVIINEMKK